MATRAKELEDRQPLDFGDLTPERLNDALRTFGAVVACAAMPGPPAGGAMGRHDGDQIAKLHGIVRAIEQLAVDQAVEQLVTLAAQILVPGLREALGGLSTRRSAERHFPPGVHPDAMTNWALAESKSPADRKEFRRQRILQAWAAMRWFRPTMPDLTAERAGLYVDGKSKVDRQDFHHLLFHTSAEMLNSECGLHITAEALMDARTNDLYEMDGRLPSDQAQATELAATVLVPALYAAQRDGTAHVARA